MTTAASKIGIDRELLSTLFKAGIAGKPPQLNANMPCEMTAAPL
jgi:hypothetical protein